MSEGDASSLGSHIVSVCAYMMCLHVHASCVCMCIHDGSCAEGPLVGREVGGAKACGSALSVLLCSAMGSEESENPKFELHFVVIIKVCVSM